MSLNWDCSGASQKLEIMTTNCKKNLPPLTTTEVFAQRYLRVVEVASLLRMSTKTVYRKVSRGEFPAIRVSTRILLIDTEEVKAMLTKRIVEVNTSLILEGVKSDTPKPSASNGDANADSSEDKVAIDNMPTEDKVCRNYYTYADFCSKYNYDSSLFYVFRQRYKIPCIDASHPNCFDKEICDKAMELDKLRKGQEIDRSQWYSCGDLKKLYGICDANIRRFAVRNGVRTCRYQGRRLLYNKVDWDAARENMFQPGSNEVEDCQSNKIIDANKWYTSSILEERYGIQGKQVRRFATIHGVRMCRYKGKRLFNKEDWDAAREKNHKLEEISKIIK